MMLLGGTSTDAPGVAPKAIRALFPPGVCAAVAEWSEEPAALFSQEEDAVRRAVPVRQHEFALGRWCARKALELLGVADVAIPMDSNRAPRWPPQVVGSITHCAGFVGAVVAPVHRVAAIGFDVEPAKPLASGLSRRICTAGELAWLLEAPPLPAADWGKVLFSAKEAIHKVVSPLSGITLDFRAVTILPEPSHGTFSANLTAPHGRGVPDFRRISGRFAVTDELVMTAAFIEE
jgi:4'-phosphopantetheinyl transferase EntD